MNEATHGRRRAGLLLVLAGLLLPLTGCSSGASDEGGAGGAGAEVSAADARLLAKEHQRRTLSAWIAGLEHPDENARSLAASTLASIGPDARPAWRPLLERAADEAERFDTRATSLRALGRIAAPQSVEPLLEILDAGEPLGPGAADALRDIGPPSVGPLVARMKAEGGLTSLRCMALSGLVGDGHVRRDDLAGFWPRLVAGLSTEDQQVRFWTMRALAGLGPDAAPAVEPLGAALGEAPDEQAREAILCVVGAVGPQAAKLAPRIEAELVAGRGPAVRLEAGSALFSIGATEPGLAAIMAMLDAETPAWRAQAVEALAGLGAAARPAVARLREMRAEGGDPGLVATIDKALEAIGE